MGPRSRFVDVERVHRRVPGCPLLATVDETSVPDEGACALCPHNLLAPGVARIGCEVRTPADVVERARKGLADRDATLAAELDRFLASGHKTSGSADDETARHLVALAESWYVKIGDGPSADAEREVARLVARFARASVMQGEPVEILG